MKLVMIFDQVQAGAGGKERANETLHAKSGPIGSAKMFTSIFEELDVQVIATMYCGDKYYDENREIVQKKMLAMINKLNPDAVLCGPAFNYEGYALMAAEMTNQIQNKCNIPVVSAFSSENATIITTFKDTIPIVKMPKKGGVGLHDALYTMIHILDKMHKKEEVTQLLEKYTY